MDIEAVALGKVAMIIDVVVHIYSSLWLLSCNFSCALKNLLLMRQGGTENWPPC